MSGLNARCIRCGNFVSLEDGWGQYPGTLVDDTLGDVCTGERGFSSTAIREDDQEHVVVHMWMKQYRENWERKCTCRFVARSGEGHSMRDEQRRHDEAWGIERDYAKGGKR